MKRTKLFIGATTCILAVAGVAATKAAKNPTLYPRYYCTVMQNKCVTIFAPCNNATINTCTATFPVLGGTITYTLYNINPNYTPGISADGCKTIDSRCLKTQATTSFKSIE